jgi:hypothetical protein
MRVKNVRFAAVATVLLCLQLPAWGLGGIEGIPQSPMYHAVSQTDRPIIPKEIQQRQYEKLKTRFYSPWDQNEPREAQEVILWALDRYCRDGIYGENFSPRTDEWKKRMAESCRVDSVGELGTRAVSLRETSLRLLPTESPAFLSPDLPGEGYPFDYLQNSLVHAGEPLYLSHLSEDGLWGWCDTSYASGWVNMADLATVNDELATRWRSLELAAVVREDVVLAYRGRSLFEAKIGTLLPMKSRGATTIIVEVPRARPDGVASSIELRIPMTFVSPAPLSPNAWTAAALAEQLMNEPYGWGGFLKNRDCSATTRDLMLPLGIWLPRNSSAQAKEGKVISLEGMSREKKLKTISREGVPFFSLIGQPGHIMLYVGTYRGKPLILHDMWGIRTERKGSEGRYIVGKTVISTLDLGEDLPDHVPGKLILDRIDRLTIPWLPET